MYFSLLEPLARLPVAVVDVETTGASAALGDRVVEIGIVRLEAGQVVSEFSQLIDPQRPIGPGVCALTGITNDMVAGQGTFAHHLPRLLPLLQNAAILGHNVRFDLSFLHREFRRAGLDLATALADAPILDTVRIARRRFGRGGNSLPVLSRRLGIEPTISHRALADAQTTGALLGVLLDTVGGWNLPLVDVYQQQGGPIDLAACAGADLLPWELEEALENNRPVMMEYVDARSVLTQRIIQPLHVRRRGGELMLVAHCQLRNQQRTFKLQRIVRLTRLEAPSPS